MKPFVMRYVDFVTGQEVGRARMVTQWGFLSPDGSVVMDRDAFVSSSSNCEEGEPDQDADTLARCDSGTGQCEEIQLEIPDGKIKVGGLSYES